jgi:hypothetical protein
MYSATQIYASLHLKMTECVFNIYILAKSVKILHHAWSKVKKLIYEVN